MEGKKPFYPLLEAEISKNGVRKKDLANIMGITPRTLSQKLSGEKDFWWSEILALRTIFPCIPPEKLLSRSE